jgi:hypothetical protein
MLLTMYETTTAGMTTAEYAHGDDHGAGPRDDADQPPVTELVPPATEDGVVEPDVSWVIAAIHGDDGTFGDTDDGLSWQ